MTSVNSSTENHEEEVIDKILTAPNIISFCRLVLVPIYLFLLFSGNDIGAVVVFTIAALSDCLDGQVARRTHTVSRIGKLLDPAIDTVLMFTGILGVVLIGRLPAWIAVLIIAREAFLLIGGGILLKRFHIHIPVIYPGKFATTFMFIGFAGMLLNMPQIPGLGICDIWWLPGFNHADIAFWIWPLYVGLALQIGVTLYYCIIAWGKLQAKLSEGKQSND